MLVRACAAWVANVFFILPPCNRMLLQASSGRARRRRQHTEHSGVCVCVCADKLLVKGKRAAAALPCSRWGIFIDAGCGTPGQSGIALPLGFGAAECSICPDRASDGVMVPAAVTISSNPKRRHKVLARSGIRRRRRAGADLPHVLTHCPSLASLLCLLLPSQVRQVGFMQHAWCPGKLPNRGGAAAAGPGAGGSGSDNRNPPIVPLCNQFILWHPIALQILLCSHIRAGSGRWLSRVRRITTPRSLGAQGEAENAARISLWVCETARKLRRRRCPRRWPRGRRKLRQSMCGDGGSCQVWPCIELGHSVSMPCRHADDAPPCCCGGPRRPLLGNSGARRRVREQQARGGDVARVSR